MSKLLILLGILVGYALITACGPANEFCENNHDKFNGFCYTLLGYEDVTNKEYSETPTPTLPEEPEQGPHPLIAPPIKPLKCY